ncbi:MAG: hypothetical protein ACPGWS_09180 [Solirubrobacterales bacterium]
MGWAIGILVGLACLLVGLIVLGAAAIVAMRWLRSEPTPPPVAGAPAGQPKPTYEERMGAARIVRDHLGETGSPEDVKALEALLPTLLKDKQEVPSGA